MARLREKTSINKAWCLNRVMVKLGLENRLIVSSIDERRLAARSGTDTRPFNAWYRSMVAFNKKRYKDVAKRKRSLR